MFFSSINFALFKLFFLIVTNLRFDTKSTDYFSVVLIDGGLESFDLAFHFFDVFD